MAPTIPISSDIVNGLVGVFMVICIMPGLEQVRVLAVNQADRLDLATTGSVRVGSRTQVWGKTTKWYGSRVWVLSAAIVVLCSLVGELMLPFSIKGTMRSQVVSAVGSQLVDRASFSRGFNSTRPCLLLTDAGDGANGVMFNRSFLVAGKRHCDQQPYIEFSSVRNRPAGQVEDLVSIEQEMRTCKLGKQLVMLVPFEDRSLAACNEIYVTGLRSRVCVVMRPLANGTFQFWVYPALSSSVANLASSRRGWTTEQYEISRLAVERNWAPLVRLVREIMSDIPSVVDTEVNLTRAVVSLSTLAMTIISIVLVDVGERKIESMGTIVTALFTDGPGTFTLAESQDVTEINKTLLGLSIGLAILPSLLFLSIGHMKNSEGNLRIDTGSPKFLAALAKSHDGVTKLDDPNEMPGNVVITTAKGYIHLEIEEKTGSHLGR